MKSKPARIGSYEIQHILGEGGMGTVYAAEQREPIRRVVALKVVRGTLRSPTAEARLSVERDALARMSHPNIASVFDAGFTGDGQPYIAMELIEGEPVTDYCRRKGLDVAERVRMMIPVCEAVQHAHQRGVIHRDLKPANILVVEREGRGEPKVIDFGLAKTLEAPLGEAGWEGTRWGMAMGTPGYMSPEQADPTRRGVDTRTDIYSLGCVLYELLTGDVPLRRVSIEREDFEDVLKQLLGGMPTRPSELVSSPDAALTESAGLAGDEAERSRRLAGDLDWITMKALDVDPEGRYASAQALALDLERHLNDEPVTAGPPSRSYRMKKFIRRNRLAVTAACVTSLAIVLGLIASLLLYDRALDEAQRASRAEKSARVAGEETRVALTRSEAMAQAAHARTLAGVPLRGFESLYLALDAVEASLDAPGETPLEVLGGLAAGVDAVGRFLPLAHPEDASIRRIAFSPSGDEVLTAGLDGTIVLWGTRVGDRRRVLRAADSGILDADYSPDGRYVAAAQVDGKLSLFERSSGMLVRTLEGHEGPVHALAWTPDSRRLVSGSFDGSVRIWDVPAGTLLHTLAGHRDIVVRVLVSPDGSRVASGSWDGTTRVWEIATGTPVAVLGDGSAAMGCIDFSPDGRLLLTCTGPSTRIARRTYPRKPERQESVARIWSISKQEQVARLTWHSKPVRWAAFSPDGKLVVTASEDHDAATWRVEGGRLLMVFAGHEHDVGFVDFAPDGKHVLTSDYDGVCCVWNPLDGRLVKSVQASMQSLSMGVFAPDGATIAAASVSGQAALWSDDDARIVVEHAGHDRPVRRLAFSPDGRHGLSADEGGGVRLWRTRDGARLAAHRFEGGIQQVAFLPDGKTCLVAERNGPLWRAGVDEAFGLQEVDAGAAPALAFASAGETGDVIAAYEDGFVRAFATSSWSRIWEREASSAALVAFARSLEGDRIAVLDAEGWVRVLAARDGAVLAAFRFRDKGEEPRPLVPLSVAFAPGGEELLTAGIDFEIRVWRLPEGRKVRVIESEGGMPRGVSTRAVEPQVLVRGWSTVSLARTPADDVGAVLRAGVRTDVRAAGFLPDPRLAFSVDDAGGVRLWSVASGAEVMRLRTGGPDVFCASATPDGRRVALGCADGRVRVYAVDLEGLGAKARAFLEAQGLLDAEMELVLRRVAQPR